MDLVEGGLNGQIVASSVQYLIDSFFAVGIKNIQNECNKVSRKYRTLWDSKPSTDLMSGYDLYINYKDGSKELEPEFELFEPSSIHVKILNSSYLGNPAVAATIDHSTSDPVHPLLTIYLNALELIDSNVIWKGFSTPFQSVIYHELLHACGDSPVLRREIHDGVIRHTMVCTEAVDNLVQDKI